jgi:TolB-like protein/Flp pilus assembly protein TadD
LPGSNGQPVATDGPGHRRIRGDPGVAAQAVRFLAEGLDPSAPSRAPRTSAGYDSRHFSRGGSLAGFSDFIAELKRRRVIRALIGWGIFSFAVLQVVEPVLHAYHLPEWSLTVVVTILGGGFPVTAVLAWVFDLTAKGVTRTAPAAADAVGGFGLTGPRLATLLLALGVLAAAPGLVYFFVWPGAGRRAAQAAGEGSAAPGSPSIAVLAFADLSPTRDQEYFSDGIAEEILNALARVKGLKVAGRTSSFHFKGKNEDLHAIGTTLGVANVLEGSVRKQGNKVRITAQLIKASDGFHLWSKTYDGDLTDVFELQERIARAITDELKVVLQGEQQARLVPVATRNPEAYALYLQSTAIFNRRDGSRFADAIAQLEQALKLDPAYARAHSRLAALYAISPSYSSRDVRTALDSAEKHARRAIELDPSLAEPHAVLAMLLSQQRRHEEERAAFERALALDPDDITANFWFATTLVVEGYGRQGAEVLDRVLVLDPILPNALMWRGTQLFNGGDLDGAERLLRRANDLGLFYVGLGLSAISDARGQKDAAVEQMVPALRVFMGDFPPGSAEVFARGVFGDGDARGRALALVDAYLATKPAVVTGIVPYALIRLGQAERALAIVQEAPTGNDALVFGLLWGPYGRAARGLPGFPEFARKVGLADLWDRHGPPDGCRRVAPRDYACD